MTGASAAPRLSCVLIFLDGERYLDEAIRSVVAQQGCDDWELLLVDDGSTDASTEIARGWAAADPARIRYLEHEGHANRGMSAARNLGIRHATGDHVTFLDCDDVFLPSAFAHRLRMLAKNPTADALFGRCWRWYGWTDDPDDAERDHTMIFPPGASLATTIEPPTLFAGIYATPGLWIVPAMCGLVVRRDVLAALGGMDASFTGLHEDQVLYAKLTLGCRIVLDGRALALYRQHPGSACEVAVERGEWSRQGPSPAEDRFLGWLESYVRSVRGVDSLEWSVVQANRHPASPAPTRRTAPDRARSIARRAARAAIRALPARAADAVHRRRAPAAGPTVDGPTVLDRWSADHFAVAWSSGAHGGSGRTLVATPPSGRSPSWRVARPALVRSQPGVEQATLDATPPASYDTVVVPVDAADAAGLWLRAACRCLRPGGRILALVPGVDLDPGSPTAAGLAEAARLALPGASVSVERFGNARTLAAVRAGSPAEAVPGVTIDHHDGTIEAVVALAIEDTSHRV